MATTIAHPRARRPRRVESFAAWSERIDRQVEQEAKKLRRSETLQGDARCALPVPTGIIDALIDMRQQRKAGRRNKEGDLIDRQWKNLIEWRRAVNQCWIELLTIENGWLAELETASDSALVGLSMRRMQIDAHWPLTAGREKQWQDRARETVECCGSVEPEED